jgi:hypothetical protein
MQLAEAVVHRRAPGKLWKSDLRDLRYVLICGKTFNRLYHVPDDVRTLYVTLHDRPAACRLYATTRFGGVRVFNQAPGRGPGFTLFGQVYVLLHGLMTSLGRRGVWIQFEYEE